MVEWLGRKFEPDAFDVGETTEFLRMLKWPRTSVSYLASILGARRVAQEIGPERRCGKQT
jgi:hypothetical protein